MQNIQSGYFKRQRLATTIFMSRHTFATWAGELNTDAKTISETLGHTNTKITINRYMRSLKEQKQKMMSGLNSYFNKKKIAALL